MAKHDVKTQLWYDGQWNDVPAYTRDPITVTRGNADEQSEPTPSTSSATVDNRTGDYNPRNPSSSLFGKIGRNTPIRHRLFTPGQDVTDTFTRTVSNSWGSADSGQAYTLVWLTGSINDFDVASGSGTQVVDVANSYRLAYLGSVDAENGEALLTWKLPVADVTGATLEPANIAVRIQSTTVYYLFRVGFLTNELVNAQIFNPDGTLVGTTSSISASGLPAGEVFKTRVRWDGMRFTMRSWRASDTEPTTWHAEALDGTYLGPGGVGVRSGAAAGNTNVPVTFTYDEFTATTWNIRSTGEVSAWKPDRSVDFDLATPDRGDAWTAVTGNGILRRLGQGSDPMHSALRQHIHDTAPIAYWPLEAGTQLAADVGGSPMQSVGSTLEYAIVGPAGSDKTPKLVTQVDRPPLTVLVGPVAGTATDWTVAWWFRAQPGAESSTFFAPVVDFFEIETAGSVRYWMLEALSYAGASQYEVTAYAYDASRNLITSPSTIKAQVLADLIDDEWHMVTLRVLQNGGTLEAYLTVDDDTANTDSVTTTSYTNGAVNHVYAPKRIDAANVVDLSMAHIAVWESAGYSSAEIAARWDAGRGHPGETAGNRFARLCAERGVTYAIVGDPDDTVAMGPQYVDTFVNALAEIKRTDAGLMFDTRAERAITYRTRASLYDQDAALALDWTAAQIAPPFNPVVDDLPTRNDVTVQQYGGTFAHAVQETGPLNVNDPADDPDGVGRKTAKVDVNAATTEDLANLAGWYLHLGTLDETRYPQVTVDLDANPTLDTAASTVDIGDRITIDNLPGDISPDLASLIVVGYTELLGSHRRTITFNCVPESAYRVASADGDPRVDTDGSELAASLDTTATSFTVSPTAPYTGLWTTDAADFPMDILIGGELITLSAISGASAPQTFTASARSVNGVVKSHAAGAPVSVAEPAYVPL